MRLDQGLIQIRTKPIWLDPDYSVHITSLGENSNFLKYLDLMPERRKGLSVLEFGCGCGGLLMQFARKGFQVFGVDANRELVERLKARATAEDLAVKSCVGDVSTVDLKDEFDLLLLDSFIINSGDAHFRKLLLENIAKHLKPGGSFIFEYCTESFLQSAQSLIETNQEIRFLGIDTEGSEHIWKADIIYKISKDHVLVPLEITVLPFSRMTDELDQAGLVVTAGPVSLNPVTNLLRCVKKGEIR